MNGPLLTLGTTMALSTVVFAVRHRELRIVAHQVNDLRAKLEPAVPSEQAVAFEPKDILETLRDFASGDRPDSAKASALRQRMSDLSPDELRSLCATARGKSSSSPDLLFTLARFVVSALYGRDNGLAADLLADMPHDNLPVVRELTELLAAWIEKNPGAALAWLERALGSGTWDDPLQRRNLERLMAQAAVMQAPVAQLPLIRSLPEKEQTEPLARGLFRIKSAEEARAFAAAVITWPVPNVRVKAMKAMMDKLLEHGGFDAAAAWLDSLPDATADQKDAARFALIMRDRESAAMPQRAEWVIAHTDPAHHADIAVRITKDWLWHDYNAAGAWLHEKRTAPWFDAAAGAFAGGIASKEPTTAFEWALTISDETIRRAALTEVMRRWRQNFPAEAQEHLRTSNLSEQWKAELSVAIPPRKPE